MAARPFLSRCFGLAPTRLYVSDSFGVPALVTAMLPMFLGLMLVSHALAEDSRDSTGGSGATPPASAFQNAPETQDEQETEAEGPAEVDPGPFYAITRFELRYLLEHPELPEVEELERIEVTLGVMPDQRFVAPDSGGLDDRITQTLAEFASDDPRQYSAQAVQHILETIRDAFPWRGVHVAPEPQDIAADATDVRPPDRTSLGILITVGRITELRTQARGPRIDTPPRVDHPLHQTIRQRSPLQPADPEQDFAGDLIDPEALDDYSFRLSRHPGRRVDTTLSAAEELSGTTLDYIITENRPYSVYAHLANTGTRHTRRWRQSFGLIHNQFTGHDDILNLEYSTASFDATNAVRGSYEAPIYGTERLRLRLHASWSDYTASDVGAFDDTFTGTTYDYGANLTANVYQRRNLFLDAFAGARILDATVDNTIPGTQRGRQRFLLPHIGVELEHHSQWYRNRDRIQLQWHTPGLINVDDQELQRLGRAQPAKHWASLSWDFNHAVHLEPIIYRDAWRDPSTPESSTLGHELALRFRGQHAFGNRLIPQLQRVAGGMHTVRGYPESATAGDTVLVGNLEYRLHVPRLLPIEPQPRELWGRDFRFAPQYVYGPADWDLAPRVFIDAARVLNNRLDGPDIPNETLMSTGLGVETLYRRNVRLRLDWGIALRTLENDRAKSGDHRLHFAMTVLY